MDLVRTERATAARPLRVWPGAIAVGIQWLAWYGVALVWPAATPWGIAVALYAGVATVLWWLLFSRAPWLERVLVPLLMALALVATRRVVHESIAGGGMGFLLYLLAIPMLCLALVVAAAIGRTSRARRHAALAVTVLLACAGFTLVRTGGMTGEGDADLHWRWSATPEERLLAAPGDEPARATPGALVSNRADWPGFRGPERDGVVRGVQIATDWSATPPVELWRRAVGPGWSSFAVRGELVYTQEQRGEHELVSCYALATGEPVWSHRDPVRFWESNAGAGPRATPSLHEGRVYTLGATGLVNALDAATGHVVWARDAARDAGEEIPEWGFAGSPLVIGDLVIVAAAGRLVAYDLATGEQRWLGPAGGHDYGSPHLATLGGDPQVLVLSGGGALGVAPPDGRVLWEHAWERGGASIVQPASTVDGDVLLAAADPMGGVGLRRISVSRGPDGWTVAERWTSRGLKPYFNDFVVHAGHAYGFDNSILACVDVADGAREWKGGRYGHGQLLLVLDAEVLLVLSEEGELALVAATPAEFRELARFRALEGKTWNHPVLVGDVLLARNAEEMAAFRLAVR